MRLEPALPSAPDRVVALRGAPEVGPAAGRAAVPQAEAPAPAPAVDPGLTLERLMARGRFETTSSEYKMEAAVDPTVLADRKTEMWARVYRPKDLSGGPFPVVLLLHGNHATCGRGENPRIDDNSQYTNTGTCPIGYKVVPNHEGYAYAADKLASQGYVVVSINANRGINAGSGVEGDWGLNLARGRLLLRHAQWLATWHREGGTPGSLGAELQGKLDLSQVGIMGHSRGGEGARAAYNLLHDPNSPWPQRLGGAFTIRGIFEIGPVDGQSDRTLDATGAAWGVLLPMCDGDVSDLQGVQPFNRMIDDGAEAPATPKATFAVWGTNHNFFNSEWQQSDASRCGNHDAVWKRPDGGAQQRVTSNAAMMAFFRGFVGRDADPTLARLFNPAHPLPSDLEAITPIERGYVDTPHAAVTRVLERFDRATGTNTHGAANESQGVTLRHDALPNHNFGHRGALLTWTPASPNAFLQTNWEAPGQGRDVRASNSLTLRVARDPSALNGPIPTDFSVQLVHADGSFSAPVPLSDHLKLLGPAQGPGGYHAILQTARLPLAAFAGADLEHVRGVRFVFDRSVQGGIYLTDVSFSTRGAQEPLRAAARTPLQTQVGARMNAMCSLEPLAVPSDRCRLLGTQPAQADWAAAHPLELVLESDTPFVPGGPLYILRAGGKEYRLSRYPDDGNLRRLIFAVDRDVTDAEGPIEVVPEGDTTGRRWTFR